ncbi:MAG: SCO family protein [Pseudomonadales bacterium]
MKSLLKGEPRAGWPARILATLALLVAVQAFATTSGSRWGDQYFPNVELTNQDGQKLRFYDDVIKGKVVAINFIFTSCRAICPAETARMRQVEKALGEQMGRDVFFYSISIDPDRDTPEVLKAYAAKFGTGPGWQFLTGKEEDVILLQKKLGLWVTDAQSIDPKDHSINLIVGNESTGRWSKRSSFDDPKVLARLLGESLHNYRFARAAPEANYASADHRVEFTPGEHLFNIRCKACHTVDGSGAEHVGPDLLGVVQRRDDAWLKRWIKEPDAMLAEKDPLAMALYQQYRELPMPNLGLSDEEVDQVIEYMSTVGREGASVSRSSPADGDSATVPGS